MTSDDGAVSFWLRDLDEPVTARDRLDGDAEADVAIVGAGYTGLWTAYYLLRHDPALRVRVLEQRHVGYGASGRNGGWLTNTMSGGHEAWARDHGVEAVRRFQLALNGAVDEVIAVSRREGIDAQAVKGGSLLVARNAAQMERLRAMGEHAAAWPEEGIVGLDREQVRARIAVDGASGGLWQPHCARVHPGRLVTGLAAAVRRLGARIHEDTPVVELRPGAAVSTGGTIRAPIVLRATEGFTARLRDQRRTWLPLNSSMIVTAPLERSTWEAIGWDGYETLEDLSHVYAYAQRTADGRIAIGGRGRPYRYASRFDLDGHTSSDTAAALATLLRRWFPSLADVTVEHSWSGVLGVPRDWRPTVGLDPSTGLGWAGGYVGTGVAATNLAGRTLSDLVTSTDSDLTSLPWVNRAVRRWEPEPLRWLGTQAMYAAYRWSDRREHGGYPSTWFAARVADRISGR
jgi:glycine/D-amino acid oxidase-like deaminating enzyme